MGDPADFNGSFQELLYGDGPLGSFADFNIDPGVPTGLQPSSEPASANFLDWHPTFDFNSFDPATALIQENAGPSHDGYLENDAPYEVDDRLRYPGQFAADPQMGTGYITGQDEIYAAPYAPYPTLIDSAGPSLLIDPQLVNAGISDMETFPDLFNSPETNMFLPFKPQENIVFTNPPSDAVLTPSPVPGTTCIITNSGSRRHAKPRVESTARISKSKGKGKAVQTRNNRRAFAQLPSNIVFHERFGEISCLPGPNQRSRESLESTQSPSPDEQSFAIGQYDNAMDIDSDETIDLGRYRTPYHSEGSSSGCSSIGEYLARAKAPSLEETTGDESPNTSLEDISEIVEGTNNMANTPEPNQTGSKNVSVSAKRGRGRPIVPGSKRQRRIHAMAQPDYVPPKRGRPRTSERHLRKRSRRVKAKASVSLTTRRTSGQPPNTPIIVEDEQSIQGPYSDLFVDEMGYKPVYFILSPAQALKIQQMYEVPPPQDGWDAQERRWQLTYNLGRVTPTGEQLHRQIEQQHHAHAVQIRGGTGKNKENEVVDAEAEETITTSGGKAPQDSIFSTNMDLAFEPTFPDRRLKVVFRGIDGVVTREMAQQEVLQKLLDERDVYFRAIVWEILKNSNFIGDMEFVGTMNHTMSAWDFI
ncbi:hypothetical protein H072_10571 [Dactylellina haptotyla CBS 200.50]|uniref:Uncharacterized protein n=1 Tax=Dactylellina haptotyla (strain CBS 200.50) TaxID=1284197 RepID=S8BL33_DACHA|nr:hypothetical protein H072_10571 [Dactylellina haptotyla CBS 200.50]